MPKPAGSPDVSRYAEAELRASAALFFKSLEYQTRVRAAKAEVVRQNVVDLGCPRFVRYVIKVAIRVWSFIVYRRRQHVFFKHLDGENCLKATGGAEGMAGHRFG